jgi:hypothetical protein
MPDTPEVEVPPKASSSTAQVPKDVINLDDIPEDPAADSGKGASPLNLRLKNQRTHRLKLRLRMPERSYS